MDNPQKAFDDNEFLQSPEGRSIRILSEYEKVKTMFEFHKIIDTITFFGSARFKSKEDNHSSNEIDIENSESSNVTASTTEKNTQKPNTYQLINRTITKQPSDINALVLFSLASCPESIFQGDWIT